MAACTSPIESGSIYLPREAPWPETLERELLAFPKGDHGDQVDAPVSADQLRAAAIDPHAG
jgi:predicted phage terminase large subunit-like protein